MAPSADVTGYRRPCMDEGVDGAEPIRWGVSDGKMRHGDINRLTASTRLAVERTRLATNER